MRAEVVSGSPRVYGDGGSLVQGQPGISHVGGGVAVQPGDPGGLGNPLAG
jgi:hypothetical protein